MNEFMNQLVTQISQLSSQVLLPFMVGVFLFGAFFRWVIYFTVRCQFRFAAEFEKRVHKYMAHEEDHQKISSFHMLSKKVLETTYYEHFELKRKFHRRRFDSVTSLTDRMFLIREGAARLIKDTLSQTQYLKKDRGQPQFLAISKFVFGSNPVFNKVLGALPMGAFNDLINILPGLFVVGGIFGTFIGVMNGLPALSQMDISNVEMTQKTMGTFIVQIAFSMGTSIVGIGLSVLMTVLNSLLSPEGLYLQTVSKFTSALEFLWNDTHTNEKSQEALMLGSFAGPEDRRQLNYQMPQGSPPAEHKVAVSSLIKLNETPRSPSEKIDPLEEATGVDPFELARIELQREEASRPEHMVRLREIEQRLQMLDVYMKMSTDDLANGIISESLWREKSEDWVNERQKLEGELQNISSSGKRAAA